MDDDRRSTTLVPEQPFGHAVANPTTGDPWFDPVQHGLLVPAMLLDGEEQAESPADLQRLHARLRTELAPSGVAEELLVERVVTAYWRLRRALAAERGIVRRQADHAALNYHLGLIEAHKRRLADPFTTIDDLLADSHGSAHVERVMGDCLADLERDGVIAGWSFDALRRLYGHDLLTKGTDGEFATTLLFHTHLERYAAGEPDGDGEERPTKAQCLGMLRHLLGDYRRRAAALRAGAAEREGHRGEAEALASLLPPPGDGERLLRHEAALEGQLYRALRELRALQAERLARAGQVPDGGRPLTLHIGRVELGLHPILPSGANGEG